MEDIYKTMDKLNKTVDELNELIGKLPWCDFDYLGMSGKNLEIAGGLDLFYPNPDSYDIRIIFEDIFYISSLMSWNTDTSKKFLKILDGDEFNIMNKKYQVEQGNYIFVFSSIENHIEDLYYIIARNIRYEIVDTFQFEKRENRLVKNNLN